MSSRQCNNAIFSHTHNPLISLKLKIVRKLFSIVSLSLLVSYQYTYPMNMTNHDECEAMHQTIINATTIVVTLGTGYITQKLYNYVQMHNSIAHDSQQIPNPFMQENLEEEIPSAAESATATPLDQNFHYQGVSHNELRTVFESAPPHAKVLVNHLKHPSFLANQKLRSMLFVGPPGVGKTTTAIAIAFLAGWQCYFIESATLQRSDRNKSNELLMEELLAIKRRVRSGEKIVVLIDELNRILEHTNDAHHDTSATSNGLQSFIDQITREGEKNIFLIGTMNDIRRMNDPMKNRFELDHIVFAPITDPIQKRNIFRSKLETPRMQLNEECDDEFIDLMITILQNCPPSILREHL